MEQRGDLRGALVSAHSLRSRLLKFFADNPDAELSRTEIAEKFFVAPKSVDQILTQARADGWLEAVHVHRLTAKEKLRIRAQP